TGSAIQLMFLDKILDKLSLDNLGVLFIHGLNPYGFKYQRKVTENNVDLNRNCTTNPELYESKNPGYAKMSSLLIPQSTVSIEKLQYRFFHLNAIYKIIKESLPVLRQAALQGQYEFENGIYYGGRKPEPQIKDLESLLGGIIKDYRTILNVDLHTGYGQRNKLHLFLNPVEDKIVLDSLQYIFKDEEIDWGNTQDFYTINGEYLEWINQLAGNSLCIPMRFEYGTLDSHTLMGSLNSIQIMISENQGAHFGFRDQKSEEKVKIDFREMYYPSSHEWRSKILRDSFEMMSRMMERFQEFERHERIVIESNANASVFGQFLPNKLKS
ncbi:MAG TPA: M14 family metallopeptidase, partial [Sunxiuqinia sp.]|nr:M14 family metallopeptidase [Sunxiuqinia sp.]